jgi:hypothetical protein
LRTALDVLRVRKPCSADWDRMPGGDRVRFCEGCRKHVHNLSAMTRGEAEQLVCEAAGRLCVRFQPADLTGTGVLTLPYASKGMRPRTWRFWAVLGGLGAMVTGAVNAFVDRPDAPPPAPVVTTPSSCPPAILGEMYIEIEQPPQPGTSKPTAPPDDAAT